MARVLITGVGGFTGRFLRRELEDAGHVVFGLTSAEDRTAERVTPCDLRDAAGLAAVIDRIEPELVAHLAAVAFVAHGDAAEIYGTNIVGTRTLLAALAARSQRPRAVLLASSANVYGKTAAGVITESVAPAPANDYAVSKLAMENMAALWRSELPITIVRPFNYTGAGQSTNFLIPKIVDHVRRKTPTIELGNLDVERDFSDVRMVVRVYRSLLENGAATPGSGGVWNVCSGMGTTLREVFALASEIGKHTPEVRVNPDFVRPNEIKKLVGSKAALEAEIGPIEPIPLRETIEWMIRGR